MPFLRARTGKVAYEIAGDGPPLILLHSGGHDRHDFAAVLPTLARSFRTIAIDWPGCGDSDAPEPPLGTSAALLCDVLEDVMATLQPGPAVLLGNSVGGTASVRFAARHPEVVRGLVLVDTGGFVRVNAAVRAFCWLQGREWVRRRLGVRFARWYMKRSNPHVDAALERIAASHARPATWKSLAGLWRSFADAGSDMTEAAASVRCPALIVWGRHDPVLRRQAEGRRARESLPRADYVELDTGHVPFVEDPPAFLQAVAPFLQSL